MPSRTVLWSLLLPVAAAAAALGGVAGWSARGGGGPAQPATPPAAAGSSAPDETARALDALRDRLDVEAASRMELALRLAAMEARLDALAEGPHAGEAAAGEARPDVGEAAEAFAAAHGPGGSIATPGRLDVDALVEAGFSRAQVEDVQRRLDQADLERLYLRDRATREGWVDQPRFAQESRGLGDGLAEIRSEYGDALYDWVLYASGRPNRVVVQDVMDGSAAAQVGLRAGDVVRRYDGGPLFRPGELRDATQLGRAGESVAVEVERDGETLRLFIPRGPLGVRIRADRRTPQPAG